MDVLNGSVLTKEGFIDGHVCIENGRIADIVEGEYHGTPISKGVIVPPPINSHTHCADGGLRIEKGMTLEELVAPPNGLKHLYLKDLSEQVLINNIEEYARTSFLNGAGTFIDFREGGVRGCEILRSIAPDSVILGRPLSESYDPEEIDKILDVADGIGLPSISDMERTYIENVADHVRSRNKMFAIHASERVREDIDTILSLDPSFIVHMVEASDSDLLKCAESEVPIVACARSNLYFGKVPPIKRMLDCGADVAIGTDNAMLCDPDLRSEAKTLSDILASQGGSVDEMEAILFQNGRKILYPHNKIHISVGMEADLTVFPCSNDLDIQGVMNNTERVFRYRAKGDRN